MKIAVIVLGALAALLIVSQLVMGLMIASGADQKMRTMHQHSGYLTVTISLIYIGLSLSTILSKKSA